MKRIKYSLISLIFLLNGLTLGAIELDKDFPANKNISILTIGNSFANNALLYLSEMTESVPGYTISFSRANIGGSSFEKHLDLTKACETDPAIKPYYEEFCLQEILEGGKFDFITIQQHSALSFVSDSYQPYAGNLIDFIREHSPQSQIIVHQTWAYSPTCPRLEKWNLSREKMHQSLVENYRKLAQQYNLEILPSGNAFYSSFQKKPGIYLWNEDGYHANINGSYLAGCVWFGKLFGVSPKKIKYVPDEMNSKTAKHLRNIAAKEVKK